MKATLILFAIIVATTVFANAQNNNNTAKATVMTVSVDKAMELANPPEDKRTISTEDYELLQKIQSGEVAIDKGKPAEEAVSQPAANEPAKAKETTNEKNTIPQ